MMQPRFPVRQSLRLNPFSEEIRERKEKERSLETMKYKMARESNNLAPSNTLGPITRPASPFDRSQQSFDRSDLGPEVTPNSHTELGREKEVYKARIGKYLKN